MTASTPRPSNAEPKTLSSAGASCRSTSSSGRLAAGQLGDPGQALRAGVGQVVDDDDVVTGLEQEDDGVAADVAGAAGHEDPHEVRRYRLGRAGRPGLRGRAPRTRPAQADSTSVRHRSKSAGPAVPGVVDLQTVPVGDRRVVVLAQQPDLGPARLVRRPAPQGVHGGSGRRPGSGRARRTRPRSNSRARCARSVVPVVGERPDRPPVSPFALVPAAGAGAVHARPRRASPASASIDRAMTSAIGERQMLPEQTKTTRYGGGMTQWCQRQRNPAGVGRAARAARPIQHGRGAEGEA